MTFGLVKDGVAKRNVVIIFDRLGSAIFGANSYLVFDF